MAITKSREEGREKVREMYNRARRDGDTVEATVIHEVAGLLGFDLPEVHTTQPPAQGMTGKSVVDNSAVDLAAADEAMWLEYESQLSGTAARRRREEQAREEEAVMSRFYRENPEAAPVDWR